MNDLLEKLDYLEKQYKNLSRNKYLKFFDYLLYSVKNFISLQPRFYFSNGEIFLKVKANTFYGGKLLITYPPYGTILRFGAYLVDPELRLTKFIIKNLKKEDLNFFDIGAHYGFYSCLIAHLFKKSKVYSFEPSIFALSFLEENKKINNYHNLEIIPKIVSDQIGFINFYDEPGPVSTILEKWLVSKKRLLRKVESITLDYFCKINNLKPDFIKIDVEGAENLIIKGAKEILQRKKPIIAMEVHREKNFKEIYLDAINSLLELGYSIYKIENNGDLLLTSLREIFNQDSGFDNLIFIHQ